MDQARDFVISGDGVATRVGDKVLVVSSWKLQKGGGEGTVRRVVDENHVEVVGTHGEVAEIELVFIYRGPYVPPMDLPYRPV